MANQKQEKVFVDGLFTEKKEFSNGGHIIKLSVSQKFIEFYNKNKSDKGYVNIDLKETRDGKLYAELNSYQPKSTGSSNQEDVPDDDLPF